MLEVKAKDQGHKTQVFSKKKGRLKFTARSLARSQDEEKKVMTLAYFLQIKK